MDITPDHDILIEIRTTLNLYIKIINDLKSDVDKRMTDVWNQIDKNTADIEKAKGIALGAKTLWLLMGAGGGAGVGTLIAFLTR